MANKDIMQEIKQVYEDMALNFDTEEVEVIKITAPHIKSDCEDDKHHLETHPEYSPDDCKDYLTFIGKTGEGKRYKYVVVGRPAIETVWDTFNRDEKLIEAPVPGTGNCKLQGSTVWAYSKEA